MTRRHERSAESAVLQDSTGAKGQVCICSPGQLLQSITDRELKQQKHISLPVWRLEGRGGGVGRLVSPEASLLLLSLSQAFPLCASVA